MALNPNLFTALYKPDVLMCLADLSNDEVFTPPDVANQILDMLPQQLFRDPNTKFLDPALKSGVFLREIAKRLIAGLADKIPNLQERCDWIFKNQLYGIAITELTSLLGRRSVYCSKYPNSPFSITKFDDVQGNIKFHKIRHRWDHAGVNGKCVFCGTAYDGDLGDINREGMETHAYEFIHTLHPEEIFNMKFDVICANPPYQLSDGGSGTGISAKPIYHFFVEQAKKLNPRYMTMIIPSRWFAGGKGLDKFREEMLKDKRITKIYDYMSSKDCFPGVNIAGGVNYFLWERDTKKQCEIHNCSSEQDDIVSVRSLDEFPVFIRDNRAIDIIHKFLTSGDPCLADHTFTRNPFGFVSKERGVKDPIQGVPNVKLISSGGTGYVKRSDIKKNHDQIDKYKVSIGKIVPSNGEVDTDPKNGYKVTTSTRILSPGEIMTESYLMLHTFESKSEAENFADYMALKFPRFMMKHTLSSMNISTQNFMFVPFLNYSHKWTDEEIYDRYGLNAQEREYVNALIRAMDE